MKISIAVFSLVLISAIVTGAQTDNIRKVDFKNFAYMAYCLGNKPQRITVKNGEYSKETQEDGYVDRFYFQVLATAFGDVTGDGRDDAIVLTVCNTGGTGNFSEGMIYSMKAGKASLIARIPGGDRAAGGLRSTRVEKGLLVVESNAEGDQGGLCCPEFVLTKKYRVVGRKLLQQGKTLREPVDRMERVGFERGKSSATLTANIPGSDSKKFVIGARAGQTLSVTVSGEYASVQLITQAEHNEDKKSFRALLPNNGDYVFEVTNGSVSEDEITVTVKIQ
jgi:hypothetical protein